MIKYEPTEELINAWLRKHNAEVVKMFDDRILLHCINPAHADARRSAVLYTGTGVYSCPSCGSQRISMGQGNQGYAPVSRVGVVKTNTEYTWDHDSYPLQFWDGGQGVIRWANVMGERVLGLGERVTTDQGRIYRTQGLPGFRLFSPVLAESTTDAIRLLEEGIDAGSICSVTNWRNIRRGHVYIPQYDEAGIKCSDNAIRQGAKVLNWGYHGMPYKDICEVFERDANLSCIIKDKLSSFKLKV